MNDPQPPAEQPWWRTAVVYQIYPRSFADENGDGIGDLAGVVSRLPYLAELGIDAIWLSPFYPSPLADGGYDIADYRDVDPRLGSLEDFDQLVADAHTLGLKILIDIVPNHTSDQHPWFQQALYAPAGSPARDRYIFRFGAGQGQPPTDWLSHFGGSAWERVGDAVVLPPVRAGATGPELGQRIRPQVFPGHPPVLGRPRSRRIPHRRRPRPGQRPGRAAAKPTTSGSTAPARRHRSALRPRTSARDLPDLACPVQRIRPAADGRRRNLASHQRTHLPLRPPRRTRAGLRFFAAQIWLEPGPVPGRHHQIHRRPPRRRRRPDLGALQPRRCPARLTARFASRRPDPRAGC